MRIQRRIYWTLPVLGIVAGSLVIALVTKDPEPWRENTLTGWLGADAYYPRRLVFLGDWVMLWLSMLADFSIGVGTALMALSFWLRRRLVIRFNPESSILFAAVFGSVAATHIVVLWTMFVGVYLLDLLVRSAAGSLCMVTAIFTVRALVWPGREE